ncbi:MAG: hypothetical protein GY820_20630 [Gammaproteobacteria bacterium]|nr:hypothetical protein [Gammaproteobacteria bacterium]
MDDGNSKIEAAEAGDSYDSSQTEEEIKQDHEAREFLDLSPVVVQCEKCAKWRLLKDCFDSSTVSEYWECSMNSGCYCFGRCCCCCGIR